MTTVRRSARFLNNSLLGSVFINTTVRAKILNPFTGRMVYADGKTGKYVQACLGAAVAKVKKFALGRHGKVIKTRPKLWNMYTKRWLYADTPVGEKMLAFFNLKILYAHNKISRDIVAHCQSFLW